MTHNGHPASNPIAGALPGVLPPGTASAQDAAQNPVQDPGKDPADPAQDPANAVQNADQPPGDDTPTVVPPPRRAVPPPLGPGHRRQHGRPPSRPQGQPTPPGGWSAPRHQPPAGPHQPVPGAGPRPPQPPMSQPPMSQPPMPQPPMAPHPMAPLPPSQLPMAQPRPPMPPQPQPQSQPFPSQPVVAPSDATDVQPSRRLVTFAVAVVMVAALAVAGWFVVRPSSTALPAAVGECVAETGPNTIKAVGCADPSAKYRVIAQMDNRTIADAKNSACAAHPKTAMSFWQGDADRPGTVLCLASVKAS